MADWPAAGKDPSALSATLPDKAAWEYPGGTDIAEIYGLETAAAMAQIATDPFSTDTIASGAWTYLGGFSVGITGGQLTNNGGGYPNLLRWTAQGQSAAVRKLRVKSSIASGLPGNSNSQSPAVACLDNNNYIRPSLRFVSSSDVRFSIAKLDGGTRTYLTPDGTSMTQAAWTIAGVWTSETERNGDLITARIWSPGQNADTDTPFATASVTLTGADKTKFGLGVSAYMGLAVEDHPQWWDDATLYEQQPEQRDLFLAVTPSSGGRTTKRLFGSSGGTFRSDFALADSPALSGTPTAPTPATKDKSTKLATTAYVDAELAALDATLPDKVAWEYPAGTDVAEVYGQRTAAALALTQSDDFNTDTTASWGAVTGADGKPRWVATTWTSQSFNGDWFAAAPTAWGNAGDSDRVRTRVRFNNAPSSSVYAFLGFVKPGSVNKTSLLAASLRGDARIAITVDGYVGQGGTTNVLTLTNTGIAFVTNTYYVFELTRNGANLTVTIKDATDTTVLYTNTVTIPAPNQAAYGSGVALRPFLGMQYFSAETPEFDWYEYWSQQPEQRDLYLAVTPSSGSRTAKRLYGSSGSSFRSDFALADSPALIGTPTTPDPSPGDKSTKIANTKFVYNALAALDATVPDKIAWEYPSGTDVVEVYGLETAAGFAQAFLDDFAANTLANYTAQTGAAEISWNAGGFLRSRNFSATYAFHHTAQFAAAGYNDQARTSVAVTFGTSTGAMAFVGFTSGGANQDLGIEWDTRSGINQVRLIHGSPGTGSLGANAELLGTSFTFTPGTTYILRYTRNGNGYIAEILNAAGTTVLYTTSGTMAAGAQASYGAGVSLKGGVIGGYDSTQTDFDNLLVETQQAEQRDLYIAVTPSSGSRTAKRLFGSLGSNFRSDYALLADPSFTGTLGLPTTTLAARPSVATVGGGRLIYVTDANPGEKFQISESSSNAWFPVSFIAPPNTQTANYTLVLTDINRAVEMNSASATTVTVPPNSSVAFPIGTVIEVSRYGAGTVAIAAGAGVTIRSRGSLLSIGNQYGAVSLRKRATDEWVLVGDLA